MIQIRGTEIFKSMSGIHFKGRQVISYWHVDCLFISINNIHVIIITITPVSPPVAASLHVARAARGEAERVYDHVSLVGADRHQLVVHVLLLTHCPVPA